MLLQDNFYSISNNEQHENVITAQIILNSQHDIFKRHFPGQPVVPGVCMIQIIKEVFSKTTGLECTLTTSSQMKFLRLLVPEENKVIKVSITIKHQEGNNISAITVVLEDETSAVFKMNGMLLNN